MARTAGARAKTNDFVPGAAPEAPEPSRGGAPVRVAALAVRLAEHAATSDGDLVVLAANERRADELGRALAAFAPTVDVLVLRPWDCFPYDRVSPSRESMGARVAVLRSLAGSSKRRRMVVTSPDAAMQKVVVPGDVFAIERGMTLDRAALEAYARRTGYVTEDRVDEPGDIAFQGQVVDVYPADAAMPVRVMLEGDVVGDLRAYDPATQRSEGTIERFDLLPACELVLPDDEPRWPGIEHWLPAFHPKLQSLFDLMPKAAIACDAEVLASCERFADRVAEAYEARLAFHVTEDRRPPAPDHLYLTREAIGHVLAKRRRVELDATACEPTPSFTLEKNATGALAAFARATVKAGGRVVIAGLAGEQALLRQALRRVEPKTRAVESWREVSAAPAGSILAFDADLELGFVDRGAAVATAVVTATDVFGARIAVDSDAALETAPAPRPGDVVVHEDHGVAVLRGLETVAVDGDTHEMLRLDFYGEDTLLVPTGDLDRIWRYGSEPDAVTLDRLHTDGWNKRRVKVSGYVEEAAAQLVALAAERAAAATAPLKPPPDAYARFTARFPFPETTDQLAAVSAVLDDLASGTPMNRLVCGDVGYGKTEVALRAAAAVALSGKQVALVAPTTVLARQHAQTFERRFAGTDVAVVQLSRLVTACEARAAKKQLASGKAGIVIGTRAVTAADVDFDDLALVIVDEEHRFGAKMKEDLKALAPHHLALSATPIPRTLQGALVGVQDVSVLAAPPARRRPVRTFLSPFDVAVARTALLRERRRDGQSFIVVPRIEEIDGVLTMLADATPDLSVGVVHGDMAAGDVDEAMVRFADGATDVLVATALIENGLDVPRANTILIWGADRFGLAQLHQFRGRVGRGRVQGTAYLFAPEDNAIAKTTADRLAALLAADKLGAGFAISARDLDLRGGGDLVGEEQAGHMRLVGASLYQHLLRRAVRAASGEACEDRRPATLQIEARAVLPADYVPDEGLRIELYAKLARLEDVDDVEAFGTELADRFGPLPEKTSRLLALRRVSMLAEAAGVTAIVAGPKGTALSFAPKRAAALRARADALDPTARWKEERLILQPHDGVDETIAALDGLLTGLRPDGDG